MNGLHGAVFNFDHVAGMINHISDISKEGTLKRGYRYVYKSHRVAFS